MTLGILFLLPITVTVLLEEFFILFIIRRMGHATLANIP